MNDLVGPVKPPTWFWVAAVLGLAWNVFGVVQFLGSINPTAESLAARGMTPDQAAVYMSIPAWMNIAFAIGVFGGLIGSGLLLMRKSAARQVLLASLAGYIVLYIGDITHGVFAALGAPQIIILTIVVAIAAALLWLAHATQRRGHLA